MEDRDIEKIIKPLKKFSLTPKEKEDLKQKLLKEITTEKTEGFFVYHYWSQTLAVSLTLVLLVGVGAAFAAENSLPGDVLYPIKTEVNEKLMVSLAKSPTAQAEVKTKILKRRLIEVEKVTLERKLEPQETEKAKEEIVKLAAETQATLSLLPEEDKKEEMEIKFKGTINAHRHILEGLKKEKEEKHLETVLSALNSTSTDSAKPKENASSSEEKIEKKSKEKINKKINEIKEKLKEEQKDKKEENKTHLESAEELIKEGEKSLEKDKTIEAEAILNQAWQNVEEAKEIKEVKKELEKRKKPEKLEIKLEGKIF